MAIENAKRHLRLKCFIVTTKTNRDIQLKVTGGRPRKHAIDIFVVNQNGWLSVEPQWRHRITPGGKY